MRLKQKKNAFTIYNQDTVCYIPKKEILIKRIVLHKAPEMDVVNKR